MWLYIYSYTFNYEGKNIRFYSIHALIYLNNIVFDKEVMSYIYRSWQNIGRGIKRTKIRIYEYYIFWHISQIYYVLSINCT